MIYFDNAATSLYKPQCVVDAVSKALTSFGNAGRGMHSAGEMAMEAIFQARMCVAEFFGAEGPSNISFTANSTMALNIALKGLLSPKDHVITSVLEHNSVLRPLYELERAGVQISFIDIDETEALDIKSIDSLFRENTRAVVITQASNLTGNVSDIAYVAKKAHERGAIVIVDASQSAGFLDIDVQKMGIDVLCFTGHKALLGPQGTGGLYVRNGLDIRPLLSGGSGIDSYSKLHPEIMPSRLEAGTANAHGLAGLLAGVNYIRDFGLENIRKIESRLCFYFYDELKNIDGIRILGAFGQEERCPIVSLNVRDYSSAEICSILSSELDIAVRGGAHCAPLAHERLNTKAQGAVRFSFCKENTEKELETAIKALKMLAKA